LCADSNGLTGKRNYSRALQQLVRGYDLVDVWEAKPTRDV
jgi:hypothetical protein